MIIGNGFIAKNFKFFSENNNFIIYASGVSNISNYSYEGVSREKKLLEETILNYPSYKIIYFSSCGIYDKDNVNSYSIHKLTMENLIKDISNNYLIFRLPIVIGRDNNKNSLCQYFFNCINNNEYFDVWQNSFRYLIDIDDVFEIIKFILDKNCFHNKIINVSSLVKIKVTEIVNMMEFFLNKKANYKLCNIGANYDIDISKLKKILPESRIYKNDYAKSILTKYYLGKHE